MTNKPTGKLAFAYNTISNTEKRIAELEAQLASGQGPTAWRDIDKDTPRGVKLQLIHRPSGVATYSIYRNCDHWTHWCALPTFSKEDQS